MLTSPGFFFFFFQRSQLVHTVFKRFWSRTNHGLLGKVLKKNIKFCSSRVFIYIEYRTKFIVLIHNGSFHGERNEKQLCSDIVNYIQTFLSHDIKMGRRQDILKKYRLGSAFCGTFDQGLSIYVFLGSMVRCNESRK